MSESGYLPIRLHSDGAFLVVSIEICNRWVEIIREIGQTGGPISHIVEGRGILKSIQEHEVRMNESLKQQASP